MRWLLAILGLTGCDRVFQLDRPEIDAPAPVTVTGRLQRLYLHNDASSLPILETIVPAPPTVRVGAAPADVTWNATDGTFSFIGADGEVSTVLSGDTEFVTRATQLELADLILGRPDQVPVPPSTTVTVAVSSPAITDPYASISSTGVWSSTSPERLGSGAFQVTWQAANFFQPAALVDGTRGDELVVLRHELAGTGSSAYFHATYGSRFKISLVGGTDNTISTPLSQLVPDACVHVDAPRDQALERLAAAYPSAFTPQALWTLVAAPRVERGVTAVISLAAAIEGPPATHASVDIPYASPLPGHDLVLIMSATSTRPVDNVQLGTSVSYYARVDRTVACTTTAVGGEPPTPVRPTLQNVLLDDGITVGIARDADPELTWELHAGTADAYIVRVSELAKTGPRVVRRYYTTEPRLVIERELFLPGPIYAIDIEARTGMPGAAAGDFTQQSFPYMTGKVTAAFKISRPL